MMCVWVLALTEYLWSLWSDELRLFTKYYTIFRDGIMCRLGFYHSIFKQSAAVQYFQVPVYILNPIFRFRPFVLDFIKFVSFHIIYVWCIMLHRQYHNFAMWTLMMPVIKAWLHSKSHSGFRRFINTFSFFF